MLVIHRTVVSFGNLCMNRNDMTVDEERSHGCNH